MLSSNITFGPLADWLPVAAPSAFDKADFFNMREDGKYQFRIVQPAPHIFAVHWGTDAKGQARRINCAGPECPLCADGSPAQTRYMIAVLNRVNDRIQLLEFGRQVYNQIVNLSQDSDWGNPQLYDLKIDRDRSRGISAMYVVTAQPRNIGSLKDSEAIAVEEFFARVDMNRFTRPSTIQEIREKLGDLGGLMQM